MAKNENRRKLPFLLSWSTTPVKSPFYISRGRGNYPHGSTSTSRVDGMTEASQKKRRRRPKSQMETLRGQIWAVLQDDHPQSVRHVFYRMTDPRLAEPVEKSEAGARTVQNLLVKMRRDGTVPYGYIRDATRVGFFQKTSASRAPEVRRCKLHRQPGKRVKPKPKGRGKSGSCGSQCGKSKQKTPKPFRINKTLRTNTPPNPDLQGGLP